MSEKKKYIANRTITFEALKGKPRVEPGEEIPSGVSDATIKDLLSDGTIEEVKKEAK